MDEFYKKYFKTVYGYVCKKIDDGDTAEELTNTILLSAWNSLPYYEGKASQKNWIMGIAKHKIIDFYRKKKIKTVLFSAIPSLEDIADKSIGPEGESLKNELKREIKEVLDELSEGYSKILRLKYVDGLRNTEIAKKLSKSYKAVEGKLARAKLKFRQKYEEKNN